MAKLTDAVKKLTITLQGKKEPKYDFEGVWVGADIRLIARTITRAYRKLQLASRRATAISNPTTGGLPMGTRELDAPTAMKEA